MDMLSIHTDTKFAESLIKSRFDIICVFKKTIDKDERDKYARGQREIQDNRVAGVYGGL